MKLQKILKGIKIEAIKGKKDLEISSICESSKIASLNSLFIAKKGCNFDANEFIQEAILAGSIAVVTDLYNPFLKITQIIVKDVNQIEADIASNFYQKPAKKLCCIAITGTNGKTTTNYLIKHVLEFANQKTSLMGTIESVISNSQRKSFLTTPDCIFLQRFLKESVDKGMQNSCLEVSSHALDQKRVKNIEFEYAIFTNLSQDHLDYHKSFEEYKIAKKKLFDNLAAKANAIINIDDENSSEIIMDCKAKIFTFSINNKASIYATDIKYSLKETLFTLNYEDQKIQFSTSLIGNHNVSNILAALSVAILKKIPMHLIKGAIKDFKGVKGRFEKVNNQKDLNIFVDFAHTPDAMENVLQILKELKTQDSKIINVFGCGGDRDKIKRPLMAKVSEKYSDITIVTSDNPRNEDPDAIIQDIIKGFSKDFNFIIENDRKKAIEKSIKLAKVQDIIIITGKGHETNQIINNISYDFDDVEIAKSLCTDL